jgi:hypothetical protein
MLCHRFFPPVASFTPRNWVCARPKGVCETFTLSVDQVALEFEPDSHCIQRTLRLAYLQAAGADWVHVDMF